MLHKSKPRIGYKCFFSMKFKKDGKITEISTDFSSQIADRPNLVRQSLYRFHFRGKRKPTG